MTRNIRKIQPSAPKLPTRKRVAAYARVSSGKDAMLHSLSAQVSYYSDYIPKHSGWEYAGVSADEAVTGTKDGRAEFQRMLAYCRARKIDMVITKSISRFARNTLILLETVRELRLINIDVFFEKENIHSLSGEGELMLTILASFAQEESLSVSQNCKWRIRNQFQQGKAYSSTILGYRLADGTPEITLEEAETVRMIYADFLSGMGKQAIVSKLIASSRQTRCGGEWRECVIDYILRNEIYTGDIYLQKTYRSNHMDKVKRINEGQLPMYYIKDNHDAIIDKDMFERVQEELKQRASVYASSAPQQDQYHFSSKIECGYCGKNYRRKISNASTKYAKAVWICTTFNTLGKDACSSQQIPEDILFLLATEALGLAEFDQIIFARKIKGIEVFGHNRLAFMFIDGSIIEKTWQLRSRKESWSDDAKQQARETTLHRRGKQ